MELLDITKEGHFDRRWRVNIEEKPLYGGNAMVVKAYDVAGNFDGTLALKILVKQTRYGRFKREVRVIQNCDHPNIISVLFSKLPDHLIPGIPPYYVLKWMDGGSLTNQLSVKSTYETPIAVAHLIKPILQAVKHLHSAGNAHRDIKPGNILFDENGDPYLSDFGLAWVPDFSIDLTNGEEVLGSLRYMAPEYSDPGIKVEDHRPGDIYSLGKTIWQMCSGKIPPLSGNSLQERDFNIVDLRGSEWRNIQLLISRMTSNLRLKRPLVDEVAQEIDAYFKKDDGNNQLGFSAVNLISKVGQIVNTDSGLHQNEVRKIARRGLDEWVNLVFKKGENYVNENPEIQKLKQHLGNVNEPIHFRFDVNSGSLSAQMDCSTLLESKLSNLRCVIKFRAESEDTVRVQGYLHLNKTNQVTGKNEIIKVLKDVNYSSRPGEALEKDFLGLVKSRFEGFLQIAQSEIEKA